MMFILVIQCDNAAFEQPREEVSRLLKKCADNLDNHVDYGKLLDVNGNTVGHYHFERG